VIELVTLMRVFSTDSTRRFSNSRTSCRKSFLLPSVGAVRREARLAVKDANREQQVIEKVQRRQRAAPFPGEAVGPHPPKANRGSAELGTKTERRGDSTILTNQ
jgi:hypothetical protein